MCVIGCQCKITSDNFLKDPRERHVGMASANYAFNMHMVEIIYFVYTY